MYKNKQPELIASVKSLNMRFINKDIINSGIGRGGLFRISLLPITYLKYLSISPPPIILLYKI